MVRSIIYTCRNITAFVLRLRTIDSRLESLFTIYTHLLCACNKPDNSIYGTKMAAISFTWVPWLSVLKYVDDTQTATLHVSYFGNSP